MVENWSGTVAQLKCNLTEYDIVRTNGFPTLSDINRVFGNAASVQILTNHLRSFMNYSGVEISDNQLAETAMAMLTNYYFLNVAEWCLFFNEIKAGKRGQIVWGTKVNNQAMMVALHDFASDRRAALDRLESEINQSRSERGFSQIKSAAEAIVKGIEASHVLSDKARSDYESFRKLFPVLPDNYSPDVWFEAYRGDEEALSSIFGCKIPSSDTAHEDLFRYLCDYNCKQNQLYE